MLKRINPIFVILLLLAFILVEGAAIVTATDSNPLEPRPTFSAGDWITQGGITVGCKCPKLSGPCICETSSQS